MHTRFFFFILRLASHTINPSDRFALFHINNLLIDMVSSLDKLLTMPQRTNSYIIEQLWTGNTDQDRTQHEPTIQEYAKLATMHIVQLTHEQRAIFDTIIASISKPTKNRIYFIDGPAVQERFFYTTVLSSTCAVVRGKLL